LTEVAQISQRRPHS